MILKRANDRYDEIKTAENRLALLHGPEREKFSEGLQRQRTAIICAEIGRNILERAFGHNQAIAILHDVTISGSDDIIDHIVIDAQKGEIFLISTQHLGSFVIQESGNRWNADYGSDSYEIEDPRRRLRRQITLVQTIVSQDQNILGLALLPPDVRCGQSDNHWIHLLRSDRFESFIVDRRGGLAPDRAPTMRHQEMLAIADLFISIADAPAPDKPIVEYINTRHGTIRVKQLPSGHYALRNQKNPELIDTVRNLIRNSSGWWNPKYHNWVVPPEVMENIREHFKDDKKV